jgi:hypothetical protein
MSRWSFEPFDPYQPTKRKPYKPKGKINPKTAWLAPEHVRLAQDMKRDFPRDDLGRPVEGTERRLVIDPRPAVMIPPRPTIMGYL